jgi:hypothetical protein
MAHIGNTEKGVIQVESLTSISDLFSATWSRAARLLISSVSRSSEPKLMKELDKASPMTITLNKIAGIGHYKSIRYVETKRFLLFSLTSHAWTYNPILTISFTLHH